MKAILLFLLTFSLTSIQAEASRVGPASSVSRCALTESSLSFQTPKDISQLVGKTFEVQLEGGNSVVLVNEAKIKSIDIENICSPRNGHGGYARGVKKIDVLLLFDGQTNDVSASCESEMIATVDCSEG